MLMHSHNFARVVIAGLLLVGFYFHSHLSGAKLGFRSAICDTKWAATEACDTPSFLNNATNVTSQAAITNSVYSIENLVTNSTLGVNYTQQDFLMNVV